jgi:tellurite resistance protein TehA-like permease
MAISFPLIIYANATQKIGNFYHILEVERMSHEVLL